MRKLASVQLLAAASLVVAFPLVASAGYSEEKAYERIQQPLNTESSEAAQRNDSNEFAVKADVFEGESYTMNDVRQRIHEETSHSTQMDIKDAHGSSVAHSNNKYFPHGRDW
ncbi:hypothetical protein [Modicisalibacter luteus]|uniref:DUF4148 domain-containing protein n=1 Tax=Modicisalibacter luteus TaxID=453962 RepID=A0ABV7M2H4_9GAMM|nr:hypothetical protein [Halomonas lutea]GHB15344.1 hypothetical protein GCM10007159_42030 [Halomonas lutea]